MPITYPAAMRTAADAADRLRALCGVDGFDACVVLGTGWADTTSAMGDLTTDIDTLELRGFHELVCPGHSSRVHHIRRGEADILAFLGRTHVYEGHGVDAVAHRVRVAKQAGCRSAIITNSAGSIDPALRIGQLGLIADQLNMTGLTPLQGAQFVDVSDLFSARARALARTLRDDLPDLTYVGLTGPQFETPAEIRMLRAAGGQIVGMSMVLETLAAHQEGLEIVAPTFVGNLGAGLDSAEVVATETLNVGEELKPDLTALLAGLADQVARGNL
ncbi:phosphorylase family protein [Streptomyces sp. NPDC055078]